MFPGKKNRPTLPFLGSRRVGAGMIALVMAATVVGCGGGAPTYRVTGKVMMRDGTPLTNGRISFQARDGSVSATSPIGREGRFELYTFEPGDGVPAGTYQVVVVPAVYADLEGQKPAPRFDAKYRRYETSGLEFTVGEQSEQFEIVLDPPSPRK